MATAAERERACEAIVAGFFGPEVPWNLAGTCATCGGKGVVLDERKMGEYVRSEREALEMSLRELARRAGCSAPYLSDLELGKRPFGDRASIRVLAELGLAARDARAFAKKTLSDEAVLELAVDRGLVEKGLEK